MVLFEDALRFIGSSKAIFRLLPEILDFFSIEFFLAEAIISRRIAIFYGIWRVVHSRLQVFLWYLLPMESLQIILFNNVPAHWSENVVILTIFSSLVARNIFSLTDSQTVCCDINNRHNDDSRVDFLLEPVYCYIKSLARGRFNYSLKLVNFKFISTIIS